MSKCIWGHSYACTGQPLHSFMHLWSIWQSLSISEKGGQVLGHPHGQPTTLVADQGVMPLYKGRCIGSSWHSPCPSSTSFTSCSSPSSLFALVALQVHKKEKKKYFLALHPDLHFVCISCLPSSLCKNVFVVVLLPHKNDFVLRHRLQE